MASCFAACILVSARAPAVSDGISDIVRRTSFTDVHVSARLPEVDCDGISGAVLPDDMPGAYFWQLAGEEWQKERNAA